MQGAHTSSLAISNENTGGARSRNLLLTTCPGAQCRKQKLVGAAIGTGTAEPVRCIGDGCEAARVVMAPA